MKKYAARFCRDESGQDLVEYALLLSLLAVATVTAMGSLASTISNVWSSTNTQLSAS